MAEPAGQVPAHLRSPHGAASVHLDALRGVAAIGVCLSHLRDLFFVDYSQAQHHNPVLAAAYLASGLGHQWVVVFFVLSGYLVGGSVLRAIALDRWSWRTYLLNRMTRLWTVLVPALVLGGVLDLAGIHLFGIAGFYGGHTEAHELQFDVTSRLTVPILIGNYTFLQGIYVPTFGSNAPLWSLANEFWYYVAFPLLACALWRRVPTGWRVVNAVLLIAVVVFMRPSVALMGLIWLMGVAIHYTPHLPAEHVLRRRMLIFAALIALGAALLWCKLTLNPAGDYVLGLVVSGLILVVLSCSRTPMPRFYQWTSHAVSRSSYTLYLVHVPLLVLLAAWIGVRWAPIPQHLVMGVAIFALVMVYAQAVWFFFERNTDAIRERIKPLIFRSRAADERTPTRV
jgi:peptidoglycan/LPS O-acetylase OafA/YrhL